MASRSRKSVTDESATSEDPYRQPSRTTAHRPQAGDETKSKEKERTTTTEKTSKIDPRASKSGVLKDSQRYDETSIRPSNYTHGIPQQRTAEDPERTPKPTLRPTPKPTPQPRLSDLVKGFLAFEVEDYKGCERYCSRNPAIWSSDVRELRELTIILICDGKDEFARRCAERLLMLSVAQRGNLTAAEANTFLKSLSKSDDSFQGQLDDLLGQLSQEKTDTAAIAPSSGSHRPESTSTSSDPRQAARRESTVENKPRLTSGTQNERPSGQTFQPRPQQEYQQRTQLGYQQRTQPEVHQTELPYRGTRQPPPPQTRVGYTSRPRAATSEEATSEVRATEAEEASEIHTVADTVGDITVAEQVRREKGIDSRTRGVGPDLSLISGNNQEKDDLHASYKVRKGRDAVEFFVKGRVFAMVWHENVGTSFNSNATETSAPLDKPFNRYTRNADGVTIFSHIRRFVIVKAKATRRYCLAIPINSYRGRGLTDKNMKMDEKQAHAIIYASDRQPLRVTGEVRLDKQPIAVDLVAGEELTPSSRLHFGKLQSIDWNVKVKNVGLINDPKHVRRLTLYFNQEFGKDDTGTEVE